MADKLKVPDQAVDPEAEYFRRLEQEQKARLAEQLATEKAVKERDDAKRLHANRCGKCGGTFKAVPFKGVEIDVCNECGAVLLDPGELEALAGKDESGTLAGIASLFSFRKKG